MIVCVLCCVVLLGVGLVVWWCGGGGGGGCPCACVFMCVCVCVWCARACACSCMSVRAYVRGVSMYGYVSGGRSP